MFAVLATAFVVAVLGRLAVVVREDRPAAPPRSHQHELDQLSRRFGSI